MRRVRGVYPRACGGTRYRRYQRSMLDGLSPRLRGNGRDSGRSIPGPGSIPALAGERDPQREYQRILWVYPRACGGTLRKSHGLPENQGLSPRLRGNVFAIADLQRI